MSRSKRLHNPTPAAITTRAETLSRSRTVPVSHSRQFNRKANVSPHIVRGHSMCWAPASRVHPRQSIFPLSECLVPYSFIAPSPMLRLKDANCAKIPYQVASCLAKDTTPRTPKGPLVQAPPQSPYRYDSRCFCRQGVLGFITNRYHLGRRQPKISQG